MCLNWTVKGIDSNQGTMSFWRWDSPPKSPDPTWNQQKSGSNCFWAKNHHNDACRSKHQSRWRIFSISAGTNDENLANYVGHIIKFPSAVDPHSRCRWPAWPLDDESVDVTVYERVIVGRTENTFLLNLIWISDSSNTYPTHIQHYGCSQEKWAWHTISVLPLDTRGRMMSSRRMGPAYLRSMV